MMPSCSEFWARLDRRRNRWDDSLAELRQAYALDPLNGEIQYHLALNYRLMRLYAEGEKFQDELAAKRGENEWDYLNRAELKLDAGDPAAAQSFLAKIPDELQPDGQRSGRLASPQLSICAITTQPAGCSPRSLRKRPSKCSTRNHRIALLTRS